MAADDWRIKAENEGGRSPTRSEDAPKATRSDVARARYWRDRAENDMDAVQDAATVRIERIGKAYLKAAREVQAETKKIIGTYAKRFGLTREEALAELQKPYSEDSRAYGHRVSRLEALQANGRMRVEKLGALTEEETGKQRAYTAKEGYRRARKALMERTGATGSFAMPDMAGLESAMGTCWAGKNYSQRIWANVARLAKTLDEEITAAYLSGKSNAKIEQVIMERFGVGFREAERLVRTETSYVNNRAALKGYADAGIEEYEYLTAHDSRTCKVCGEMDGERVAISEARAGENMPPMHPNCRCTVLAAVESALDGMTDEEMAQWVKDGAPEDVGAWLKTRREGDILTPLQSNNGLAGKQTTMDRRVLVDGEYIKPISKSEMHRIQKSFKRNGGLIISGKEADKYLIYREVQGITYDAKTIMLASNPTRATVFEELIHTAQFRDGLNDGSFEKRIQCEITAKEKLLKHAKAYKLTDAEIRETKKLLALDMQDMLEYKRREER